MHECKLEEGSPNDVANTSMSDLVQRNDVGDITTKDNPLPEDSIPEGMGQHVLQMSHEKRNIMMVNCTLLTEGIHTV